MKHCWFLICLLLLMPSCREDSLFDNTVQGNFDALWTILDERYCFFEMKEVDWNEVRSRYQPKLKEIKTWEELFNLFANMLNELKDGHVNLISGFDVSRYEAWFDDYPENFNYHIVEANYLGKNYQIAGGLRYKIIEGNIGYVYYGNFSSGVGEGNLEHVLNKFKDCKGMIFDVRNNGGGNLSYVETIVSRFTREKTLVGYSCYKTGKGHGDFSDLKPVYAVPSAHQLFTRPVVVLTNRSCYSATNDFANRMRYMPQVTLMGDKTGGGGGFPFSSELPVGWSIRFSAAPSFDREKKHIEEGIKPDIYVSLQPEDEAQGKDTIIERAKSVILGQTPAGE